MPALSSGRQDKREDDKGTARLIVEHEGQRLIIATLRGREVSGLLCKEMTSQGYTR